ncbi:ATP-binding cassette domain-containing protein [Acidiferrobacter sp.]|uniref:ATP-binding cassette domain-containing protein n=1 Tax=Acidiferrobacter sp. TaxID=1872107 RepID=UPI002602C567|nr:ATP-binding cassette domain-containing protein [Acidiferrobacter sp.]
MAADAAILAAHDLRKGFRDAGKVTTAISDISFEVPPGSVTGLLGPDGAGKTTLMRLCAGLLLPDSGRLVALGHDSRIAAERIQQSVGYMPQRFGLYEDLTVQENLDLYADLNNVDRGTRAERYGELLRLTGLGPFGKRLARDLSGGMKQKLGLACTLVRPQRLLLLDEPTVGVDPISRRELWAIVTNLVESGGTSILVSTAYLDEAERCQNILLIHQGKVLDQGPPADFRARMAGRSFVARADGSSRRALQGRMAARKEFIDVIVQQEGVHVVLRPDTALPVLPDITFTPVPPRFEDAFMERLRDASPTPAGAPVLSAPGAVESSDGTPEVVIAVHELRRVFGSFEAVRGISFRVHRGQIFGLLGANGAGKTTTFRMLCGLLPPSSGTLTVAGIDVRRAAAAARMRMGYMSQKFSLYGDLSVSQNLEFFAAAYGLRGARRAQRLSWAEEVFELGAFLNVNAAELALGFKQRLALACALIHEPKILFLDEPTSGVDPLARREFWGRINALAEQGVTIMVTTHFMEEAEYCDELVLMSLGSILAAGAPAEIRAQAATAQMPDPTMDDAFVALIAAHEAQTRRAS